MHSEAPLCVHCQAQPGLTQDHVPPATIFPDSKAKHIPVVPACTDCNNSASADDEYFRDTLVKHYRVSNLPQAQKQLGKSLRAAALKEKRRYAEATMRAFTEVDIVTPGGLFLGRVPGVLVDNERILRVVRRTIRGLYYLETADYIPSTSRIEACVDPESWLGAANEALALLADQEPTTIEEGVFWYSWRPARDNSDVMVWLLVFFDEIPMPAIVAPADRFPTVQQASPEAN